jgi:hypothetical protein
MKRNYVGFRVKRAMKRTTITPRLLRSEDAAYYVGGENNLKRLKDVGWIRPLIQQNRCTAYDVRDLDLAVDRAQLSGWPEPPGKVNGA